MNLKQLFYLLLSMSFLFGCGNKEEDFLSAQMFNLRGKPYKVSFTKYGRAEYENNKVKWKYPITLDEYGYEYVFNKGGQLVRITDFYEGTNYWNQPIKKVRASSEFKYLSQNELLILTHEYNRPKDSVIVNLSILNIPSIAHLPALYDENRFRRNINLGAELIEYYSAEYKVEPEAYETNTEGFFTKIIYNDSLSEEYPNIEFEYNDKADLERITEIWEGYISSNYVQFDYSYDEKGNWVEQLQFNYISNEKKLWQKVERKIEYYCPLNDEDVSLIGFWKEKDSDNWIEFMSDFTYDLGEDSDIVKSGTWSRDNLNNRLTLRSNKGGEKFNMLFLSDNCDLVLSDPLKENKSETYIKVK